MHQKSTTERAKENLGLSTALLIGVILAFGWRPWTSSTAVSGDLQSYETPFQASTTSLQDHPCCHARARTITWPADSGSKKTYPSIFDSKNQQRKQHRKIIRLKKHQMATEWKKIIVVAKPASIATGEETSRRNRPLWRLSVPCSCRASASRLN